MTEIITRVGTAFRDKDQYLFDERTKRQVPVSPGYWEKQDRPFGQLENSLSASAIGNEHIIKCYTPISDQGRAGSCTSHAWCDALEILMGLENPNGVVQLSRLFLYWTARSLVGTQDKDSGSFIRAAAHQLRRIGVVDEKWYEYDVKKVFAAPELDLYTMASNNRINSFYRIVSVGDRKIKDIEKAIRANHPVVFGTEVGQEFMSYRGGNQVFSAPTKSLGRHAMILIGVREYNKKKQFLTRNSWSIWWGDSGLAWLDEEYIKSPITDDIWVPTRMRLI